MREDDKLPKQALGMKTGLFEIRLRTGACLKDSPRLHRLQLTVAGIFLQQLGTRERMVAPILCRPDIHLVSLCQDLLRTHGKTAAMGVVGKEITGMSILQQGAYGAASARNIPHTSRLALGKDGIA